VHTNQYDYVGEYDDRHEVLTDTIRQYREEFVLDYCETEDPVVGVHPGNREASPAARTLHQAVRGAGPERVSHPVQPAAGPGYQAGEHDSLDLEAR
jgi:hypothetical protein